MILKIGGPSGDPEGRFFEWKYSIIPLDEKGREKFLKIFKIVLVISFSYYIVVDTIKVNGFFKFSGA